jgi:hypothetical protein
VRHAFRAALTYNVPTWNANFLSKTILGNWSIDALTTVQSGAPVDLVGGRYLLPDRQFLFLRPNLVPGQPLYIKDASAPGGRQFNPAAFTRVPTGSNRLPLQGQGTLGRNVMRSFSLSQTDIALHRQFNLTEQLNLQFRSEFFNVFNHPNFGNIGNFCCSGTFGEATSTLHNSLGGSGLNSLYQVGGPRSIQLALNLSF